MPRHHFRKRTPYAPPGIRSIGSAPFVIDLDNPDPAAFAASIENANAIIERNRAEREKSREERELAAGNLRYTLTGELPPESPAIDEHDTY